MYGLQARTLADGPEGWLKIIGQCDLTVSTKVEEINISIFTTASFFGSSSYLAAYVSGRPFWGHWISCTKLWCIQYIETAIRIENFLQEVEPFYFITAGLLKKLRDSKIKLKLYFLTIKSLTFTFFISPFTIWLEKYFTVIRTKISHLFLACPLSSKSGFNSYSLITGSDLLELIICYCTLLGTFFCRLQKSREQRLFRFCNKDQFKFLFIWDGLKRQKRQ